MTNERIYWVCLRRAKALLHSRIAGVVYITIVDTHVLHGVGTTMMNLFMLHCSGDVVNIVPYRQVL